MVNGGAESCAQGQTGLGTESAPQTIDIYTDVAGTRRMFSVAVGTKKSYRKNGYDGSMGPRWDMLSPLIHWECLEIARLIWGRRHGAQWL